VAEGVGESGNEPPGTAVDRCISAGVEQSASWIVDKAADSTTKKILSIKEEATVSTENRKTLVPTRSQQTKIYFYFTAPLLLPVDHVSMCFQ